MIPWVGQLNSVMSRGFGSFFLVMSHGVGEYIAVIFPTLPDRGVVNHQFEPHITETERWQQQIVTQLMKISSFQDVECEYENMVWSNWRRNNYNWLLTAEPGLTAYWKDIMCGTWKYERFTTELTGSIYMCLKKRSTLTAIERWTRIDFSIHHHGLPRRKFLITLRGGFPLSIPHRLPFPHPQRYKPHHATIPTLPTLPDSRSGSFQ